ncbi:MAG: hypothetical protein ACFFBY_05495 [Promethearchaeota archaeon]
MVDFNTVKLKDLIEMKFGTSMAQEIITAIQTSIDNKESKAQLKERLWQDVIKPKLSLADAETLGIWCFLVELSVFIPAPPELNI